MSATEHRTRLVAIFAADAAGYSRLMAANEAATVAALDAARAVFRSQIESNQGRVIDMAGDSVLSVFDLATGAVTAALKVQEALATASNEVPDDRRMRFRIGVHLGEIIEKADGSVYGDGVNIAARLEGLAEPGGVTISDSVRNAVKGKVDTGFEDLGEQAVKNMPEPVRAYRLRTASADASKPKPSVTDIDLSLPEKPSIAVLPFTNMSGDPEQEYFTDGVSEDIITELSRFKSLFVIARNSTFSYKGKSADVRQVGKELGVRYVLEGSIRKASNRIRVTAQLIDSLTGNHIWAERYDRALEDIFAVQEEVTRAIVSAIAPQIDVVEREKARRGRPESLSAYEIAVRANANASDAMIKSDAALREQAVREARDALAIDPRSSLALNALAFAQFQHVLFQSAPDRKAAFTDGLAAAMKAIEIDPSDSRAHSTKAFLVQCDPDTPRWDEALSSARHAHELNPNSIFAVNSLSNLEVLGGNHDRAAELLRAALRMSPRDALICYVYSNFALTSCLTGAYPNGVAYARQGISAAPGYGINHAILAMNYVGLGEIVKARAAFDVAQRLSPSWVEQRLRGAALFRSPHDVQRATTFLKIAAGLEDPSAAESVR